MKGLLFIFPVCLLAQSGVHQPHLGDMIDGQGVLRPVFGVAGSFVPGEGKAQGAVATACAQWGCVAKLDNSLVVEGASVAAPAGPAIIGLDSTGAVIYFAAIGQFARLQGGALTPIDLHADGEVVSIRSGAAQIELGVRREDEIRIVKADGSVLDFLPVGATSALLLSSATVYATAEELVLRRANGSEQHFQAPGVRELFAMGDGWVQARSARVNFALRTDPGSEHLYMLPESAGGRQRRP
jgi:hypothetical protein